MKLINIYILITTAFSLSACAETSPRIEAEFGQSVLSTLNAQIINPEAGNNSDPVTGLDGRAARDAINNYQKSFDKPVPAPNVFTLGVGSGNSGN